MGRSLTLVLGIVLAVVIYAYGFDVTQVNLDEIRSPQRQERLVRITRALARPDIFEYEREEFQVNAPILVPCPPGELEVPAPDTSGPYLVLTPPCAAPGEEIQVEGFNFEPNTSGPLNFIPPSGVSLQRGQIETDGEGHFVTTIELPRRPSDQVQHIRAVTRRNVGLPRLTRTAHDTWDKIVETVFLALLATTLSTLLAIPLSFLAARNLMREITSPLPSVALAILAWPAGLLLGAAIAAQVGQARQVLTGSLAASVGGLIAGPIVIWGTARWALPHLDTHPPGLAARLGRWLALLVAALLAVLVLYLLADLTSFVGRRITQGLGALSFLGMFLADVGDILGVIVVPLAAVVGGAVLGSAAGRAGQFLDERATGAAARLINVALAVLAGAALGGMIGLALGWLYELGDPARTLGLPAAVGALGGLAIALRTGPEQSLPIGLVIYYISRTIWNALRSIEAFILVIVFVVWVGIGPFAGVLALALHSIAAMAKLYSEQVESIQHGPLEAIKATGATRLQTIVYAVIPQVVPPYISFTMYRWDINVRMSTIIGFAGGGGIGFLLQQNINLLNYRAAAAQIVAIAVVVATMDYLSSRLREKAI